MIVYKYHVGIDDLKQVKLPARAQILCVQVQRGEPYVWALVNPDAALVTRTFRWRGTGHPCDGVGDYVGTVQLLGGSLGFHLFVDSEAK